jgi:YD repeat-containing protein
MRDIHTECNGEGNLLSLINTNGEKFTAEYRLDNNDKEKISSFSCLLTYPDKRIAYLTVIDYKKNGTRKIIKGRVSTDGFQTFIPIKQEYMRKKSNTLAFFEKKFYERTTKIHRDGPTLAVTGKTDALGRTTRFTYNDRGLKTSTTFADGSSVKLKYDKENRIVQKTDEMGRITEYKYNGHQLESVNELGRITKYEYNKDGLPLKTTLPDKTTHIFSWDSLFRMTSHLKPDGTLTLYSYPKTLNNITKINIRATTLAAVSGTDKADSKPEMYSRKFSYDPYGRLIKIQFPDKTSRKFRYDCCNLTETVDRAGAVTKYAYDAAHRMVLEVSPNKEKTIFKYDNMNNVTKIIYPNTTIASYKYDEYKNRTESITPEGAKENAKYDIIGNRIGMTYPNRTKNKFKYDLRNRLIAIAGTHQDNIRNKYNAAGQITSSANYGFPAQTNPRTTTYSYDKLGRLLKTSFPDGTAQVRYYIGFSNKLKALVSKGVISSYKYDNAGRLIAIAKYSTADLKKGKQNLFENNITETRSYDSFGNLKEIRRATADNQSASL